MEDKITSEIGAILVVKDENGRRQAFVDMNTGKVLESGGLSLEYLQNAYDTQVGKIEERNEEAKEQLINTVKSGRRFIAIFGLIALVAGIVLFSVFPSYTETPMMSGIAMGAFIVGLICAFFAVFEGWRIKKYKNL